MVGFIFGLSVVGALSWYLVFNERHEENLLNRVGFLEEK